MGDLSISDIGGDIVIFGHLMDDIVIFGHDQYKHDLRLRAALEKTSCIRNYHEHG